MWSIEGDDEWAWCYVDRAYLTPGRANRAQELS